MAAQHKPEAPEQDIDVTAAEWLVIIVTGFTGVLGGPLAILPGAVLLGMFAYRVNPELMRNSKAGVWVRGLLEAPAPANAPAITTTAPTTHQASFVAQRTAHAATPTGTSGKATARDHQLAMVDLARLANASTILLVGSRGSGKSTLLRAILAAKTEPIMVYDPHASPRTWPMATLTHNSEQSISAGLTSAYKRLLARREELRNDVRSEGWPRFTLAADEWGSIVSSVELPKAIDKTPGELTTLLLKEGRKFAIGFVAGAHGKTNASLGCDGDQEAFLASFDWIINLGGFARKTLAKDYAELWADIPKTTNSDGITFPLIVVCEQVATGELFLLDMRGLDQTIYTNIVPTPTARPWERPAVASDTTLLAGMLAGAHPATTSSQPDTTLRGSHHAFHASEGEVADSPSVAATVVTPADMAAIIVQLQRGTKPSTIAKSLPGYNGRNYQEFKARVEYVKRLLDDQPDSGTPRTSTDDDEEPPAY